MIAPVPALVRFDPRVRRPAFTDEDVYSNSLINDYYGDGISPYVLNLRDFSFISDLGE